MGAYLNSNKPSSLYLNETKKPYFVDKTAILKEIIPLVEEGSNYICITRPRRFGKTIMANMIASFFGKSGNGDIFTQLDILKEDNEGNYKKHLNQYNVIYIPLNEMPRKTRTYEAYIDRIEERLMEDLRVAYPECKYVNDSDVAIWDVLNSIHENYNKEGFIFVLDEWDFIFHRDFVTEQDKKDYITFLSNLLKDQPYVEFAYITGILPIAKYSSGSEINMFLEYTMASKEKYADYFGFTDNEVDTLFSRYKDNNKFPKVTREGLRAWYDGYFAKNGEYLYNPRSVVAALGDNQLADYWTSSGPYDEIYYYVKNNIAELRDDIAVMMSGVPVKAHVEEYSATSQETETRDQILSAMVVFGFLTSDGDCVYIPNKELMDKFADMVRTKESLGYIYNLAKVSKNMLDATRRGDTTMMEEILQKAHDSETGMLGYSSEAELSAIVRLVYLEARDSYDVQREDKAGVGYVDYVFYPVIDKNADCIIIELKVDDTADNAIQQIKDRKYAQRFEGKIGENPKYTGRILAVGIAYDRRDSRKRHECKVEVLRGNV